MLNISANPLQSLKSREFHSKGYSNLQRIYASRCHIAQIADDAFHLLTNLVELDLSGNDLSSVPTRALSDCSALRRLSLSHNPIEVLHDDAFRVCLRLLPRLVLSLLPKFTPFVFRSLPAPSDTVV